MTDDARLERFNFDTMSGVYPGTRTQIFQRVLLRQLGANAVVSDRSSEVQASAAESAPAEAGSSQRQWAVIHWYEDPPACVIRPEGDDEILRVESSRDSDVQQTLNRALAETGKQAVVCGNCQHWQSGAGATTDGLPLGTCMLRRVAADDAVEIPLLLGAQSTLALACPHWRAATSAATSVQDGDAMLSLHPLPKVAEISESKMKVLHRWRMRLRRWLKPPAAVPSLADRLVERSGVGAGTEPCPCCQGRIANLGALAVEDDAGDKQTLSVWRCRVCHSLYLSDWIDRWERVDSLETEETIYRIAPVEAAEILTLIASVQEAEHPRRRGERSVERAWILAQVADREPVSHVIKQGR